MAVTNFTEKDFPKGEKVDEQHNEPREDNKILAKEIEHAVRDENEGDNYAKDFAERVNDANAKLQAEIENSVKPDAAKKFQAEVRKEAKAAEEAKTTVDELASAATGVSDEEAKSEDEAKAEEKKPAARKTAAKKTAAKSDDKPTD